MPSARHEALIELFQQAPEFAPQLLELLLGVEVPRFERARLDSTNLTEAVATEYRADAVVVLTEAEQPVLAVIVEVQLSNDRGKWWSWPVYVATLRARLHCPVHLMVVCATSRVATWCAQPIDLGHPGFVLTPMVVGPDRLPVIDDVETAVRHPELAILAAIAHADRPDVTESLVATVEALQDLDDARATLYHELLRTALPLAAKRYLEEVMALREYRDPFVRKHVMQGRAEGEVKGEAKSLIAVLTARGITVPAEVQARINQTDDSERLMTWIRRAVTAETLDEVFA